MAAKMRIFLPLLIDIFAPMAAYYLLHAFGLSDFLALTLAGLIAGVKATADLVRKRRFKSLALGVFLMFVLTVILVFVTRDARFILIKPSIYIEVAAFYILATTLGKPFVLEMVQPFATDGKPEKTEAWENAWKTSLDFRRRIRTINALCGLGGVLEGVARTIIVLHMPVRQAVLYANIPFIVFILFCGLLGRFYLRNITQQAMENVI